MSEYTNVVRSKEQTIKVLFIALGIVTLICVFSLVGWMSAPSKIRVHIPPDLSSGTELGVDEVGKHNVYIFAFYLFQQLNRWPTDGKDDYFERIHSYKAYLTPSCFQDRLNDYDAKLAQRELAGRSRFIEEIPGRQYSSERVKIDSPQRAWVVSLDVFLRETMRGEPVKDRFINYPIRVVKYKVDDQSNPWGLALDCFAHTPTTIETITEDSDE